MHCKMKLVAPFLLLAASTIFARAEDEMKKPCKTEDGKEVQVGEQYDKPGACYANICSGDDVFAVAECGIRGFPKGRVLTEVDPSKGFPACCANPIPPLEIVPDVLDGVGYAYPLDISYGENVTVKMGNELTPTQVKEQPLVNFTGADASGFYLLAMVDPDAPSVINPEAREFLHWLVGNIPGGEVPAGDVLAEYVGSGPPKDTGLHRYVFLLYKQPGKLAFEEGKIDKTTAQGRGKFKVQRFTEKYKLELVALNVYQAEYDDYVPVLHKQFGAKSEGKD